MATPSWDDINKLQEQNRQMWIWIVEQKTYIKALTKAIPSSLLDDLATTLPPLPDIPESLALWEPRRILKSPVDDSQPFIINFPEKPKLPPRESSAGAMKFKGSIRSKTSHDSIPDAELESDILDHYPVSGAAEHSDNQPMQDHEALYLAYESSKETEKVLKAKHRKNDSESLTDSIHREFHKISSKDAILPPEKDEQLRSDEPKYKVQVLYTTRGLTAKGKEAMSLIISVCDAVTNDELFKLNKQYSHLAILDVYIRKKDHSDNVPLLPEKYLFQTFSPYKFDLRKSAVEAYLDEILNKYGQWKEVKAFMRSNIHEDIKSPFVMEGFLFRREKQGSSWKAKFYYIKDSFLISSDRQGEPPASSMDFKNMTVSRLNDVATPTENDYCHAFILYDSKSSTSDLNQEKQHFIFCCENDKERDLWVYHLGNEILKYRPKDKMLMNELGDLELKDTPASVATSKESPKLDQIPSHPGLIPIADQAGDVSLNYSKKKSDSSDVKNSMGKFFKNKNVDKPLPQTKRIFGGQLADAVAISQISKNLPIPAIVYRCIEYLEHQKAWADEGIYRLSGMSTEIHYLRGKYESDLDFDLIHQERLFDTNAVAGLLKLYLRELPAPLFPEHEVKASDANGNLEVLREALSKIPYLNYILLRTIFGHLARIAKYSSINKMSPQNLSIIFSPTLQLSPLTFNSFLNDFESVFCRADESQSLTY